MAHGSGLWALSLALLASVHHAESALAYVKGGSKDICAGIEVPCTDYSSCTKLVVGPCMSSDEGPALKFTSSFTGLAFVNTLSNYNNNAANFQVITPWAPPSGKTNGYRDFNSSQSFSPTASYAYVMSGGYVGDDPNFMGGYVGVANYLVQSGTVNTPVNKFFYADLGQGWVQRGDSPYGAPKSQDVCISPLTADGKCGGDITYSEGDMKFSIYGFTTGSNYSLSNLNVKNASYLGFRVRYAIEGVAPSALSIKFNGGSKTLDTIADADVVDIQLSVADVGDINLAMPTKYNYGSVTNTLVPVGTKNVRIRALKAATAGSEAGAMFLDYFFDAADLNVANKFFVYDPSVKATVAATARAAYIARTTAAGGVKTTPAPGKGSASTLSMSVLTVLLAAASALFLPLF